MLLALNCSMHSVRLEFRLIIIWFGVLRTFCDLCDHPTWINTRSSFQWISGDRCRAWDQSWPLLLVHAPSTRYLHVQLSYEALLTFVDFPLPFSVWHLPPLSVLVRRFAQDLRCNLMDLYPNNYTCSYAEPRDFLNIRHQYSEGDVCSHLMNTLSGKYLL